MEKKLILFSDVMVRSDLLWKEKYLVMLNELRKAQKGIRRRKKREKYLLDCIDSNREFYKNSLKNIPTMNIDFFEKFIKEFTDENNKLTASIDVMYAWLKNKLSEK